MRRDTNSFGDFSSTSTSVGNPYSKLIQRLSRLPVAIDELCLSTELALYKDSVERGQPDHFLHDIIESVAMQAEAQLLTQPFVEPHSESGLNQGDHHILDNSDGTPVCVSFNSGQPTKIDHLCLFGKPGKGKSSLMAVIACSVAPNCHTFIIDVNKFFRQIPQMRYTHAFVRWEPDFRLNLLDCPVGVPANQFDQTVVSELSRAYGLQFSEYMIQDAVRTLRENGTPNLVSLLEELRNTKVPGWSNKKKYLDSAILIISNLLHATGELFRCKKGMSLDCLLQGNVVLELDGLLVKHQAFVSRFIFEYLHLASLAGRRP